jgi:hypothetical protein
MKYVSIAAGLLVCSTLVSCASPSPEDDVIAEAARRVAADGGPKSYTCRRVRQPITVDGRLTDAEWSHAPWTDDFVDIEGSVRPEPRFRTRAKMLWDDEYLYVSAWLEEPHVWGTLTEYDQIVFYDNDFEIFIDPNGDTEEYYEIEINALGTIFDLFLFKTYRNGGPRDARLGRQGYEDRHPHRRHAEQPERRRPGMVDRVCHSLADVACRRPHRLPAQARRRMADQLLARAVAAPRGGWALCEGPRHARGQLGLVPAG